MKISILHNQLVRTKGGGGGVLLENVCVHIKGWGGGGEGWGAWSFFHQKLHMY